MSRSIPPADAAEMMVLDLRICLERRWVGRPERSRKVSLLRHVLRPDPI